jgi:DNA-binding LacI/PurR family transcriptional regulator
METGMAISGRKKIGFIISETSSSTTYENELWTAAHDAAIAKGFDLVIIVGSDFSDLARTGISSPRNMIYDMCDPEDFDGIVLATTTTCMGLDAAGSARFIKRFEKRPLVLINGPQGNYRSLVDNKGGVYGTITHLIKEHGKKRIGYIRGPEGTEADDRFAAYKKALSDNGLPYDDSLVFMGKFLQSSGVACAKEFIGTRKVRFDAIAAANDSMAIGVVRGLRELGMRVPEDVAVVGFDDNDVAAIHNPPLTTVRQPVYAQAYRAIEMVCDLIGGKSIPRDQAQETEAVFRQSCGCRSYSAEKSAAAVPAGFAAGNWKKNEEANAAKLVADCGIPDKQSSAAREFALRTGRFIGKGEDSDELFALFGAFHELAFSSTEDPAVLRAWRSYVKALVGHFSQMAESKQGELSAERLSFQLELIMRDLTIQAEGMRRLSASLNTRDLRRFLQAIGVTYEISEILGILNAEMPKVGVAGYSLALADSETAVDGKAPQWLRQKQAYVDGKAIAPDSGNDRFDAARLFFRNIFDAKRRTIVVFPLTFGAECIGIIAMETNTREGHVFDEIARQLSASMAGSRLLNDSRSAAILIAERYEHIKRLVLPMIESLEHVARLASGKSQDVKGIADMAQESNNRLDGTIATIGRMSKSIGGMAGLIKAIDDISATINLVSLNASIEASHAGQYGKGFSVIAKEIKKLAESTQEKSAEISASIAEVRGNMGNTTKAGQQCMDSYNEEETGVKTLIEIFEAITRDMQSLASDGRKILDTMKA